MSMIYWSAVTVTPFSARHPIRPFRERGWGLVGQIPQEDLSTRLRECPTLMEIAVVGLATIDASASSPIDLANCRTAIPCYPLLIPSFSWHNARGLLATVYQLQGQGDESSQQSMGGGGALPY